MFNYLSFRHGKEITHAIIKFKNGLLKILEYSHHPLPAICSQAVHITCWFYLFLSTLSGQAWCCHYKNEKDPRTTLIWVNYSESCLFSDSDVFGEQKSGSGQVWGLLFGVGSGSGINISGTSPLGFQGFLR